MEGGGDVSEGRGLSPGRGVNDRIESITGGSFSLNNQVMVKRTQYLLMELLRV
jgi:hypothetical protein